MLEWRSYVVGTCHGMSPKVMLMRVLRQQTCHGMSLPVIVYHVVVVLLVVKVIERGAVAVIGGIVIVVAAPRREVVSIHGAGAAGIMLPVRIPIAEQPPK